MDTRDDLIEALRKAVAWGEAASTHILYREKINWRYLEEARETLKSYSLHNDLFGWVRTANRLPGEPGEQTDVLMWSPEWATWLKGMVTRWMDGTCEWSIYNQQDDRYHEWEYPPEFWMCPILPNAIGETTT